ncbi:hypothetical protein PR048_010342 [Dryococelus australis]|uniref:Uncharacterized protein n=1 Tax=Dryococelus australis TaxID=614101 RepID=A0ABQ9I2I1_9NEOP|nr:hypothetical protein PR048_010342 [Dryococelus australis]
MSKNLGATPPGNEPGSPWWEANALPLHHRCPHTVKIPLISHDLATISLTSYYWLGVSSVCVDRTWCGTIVEPEFDELTNFSSSGHQLRRVSWQTGIHVGAMGNYYSTTTLREIWVALNKVLRADKGEMRLEWSSARMYGWEKWEIFEKTHRPAALFTIGIKQHVVDFGITVHCSANGAVDHHTTHNINSDVCGLGIFKFSVVVVVLDHTSKVASQMGEMGDPDKTRQPAASVIRPGIEPNSPWWEASRLTTQPPMNGTKTVCAVELNCYNLWLFCGVPHCFRMASLQMELPLLQELMAEDVMNTRI